jgi:hypothetical protein
VAGEGSSRRGRGTGRGRLAHPGELLLDFNNG